MGYSGYTERLCLSGHYSGFDAYDRTPPACDCGAPFRYSHGVDQTNGYDEECPYSCDAPKIEIGRDDVWHKDHLGNRYATERLRFAPAGEDVWIKINSRGHATPPYPDDLAIVAGARSDETGTGSGRRPPERAVGIAQGGE